jgi:hypothetical protein
MLRRSGQGCEVDRDVCFGVDYSLFGMAGVQIVQDCD